jgi:hypothetical protein
MTVGVILTKLMYTVFSSDLTKNTACLKLQDQYHAAQSHRTRETDISFMMNVRPSVLLSTFIYCIPTGRVFSEIWYWRLPWKSAEKVKSHLNSKQNIRRFIWSHKYFIEGDTKYFVAQQQSSFATPWQSSTVLYCNLKLQGYMIWYIC